MAIRVEPSQALADPRHVIRRARDENFPVALRILPRATRAHLLAVYGFARLTDDTGDEAIGDRLTQLDALEAELDDAFAGRATHPVFVRLQATITACHLSPEPFRALIDANRRDQTVHRYATWDDLVGYCALSANPVGRLVLSVFGASTPANDAWSDDVCTALQVVEHVQDLGEDCARGRVYMPVEDLVRFQCSERDLALLHATPAVRAVVAYEVARARTLLLGSGRALCAQLRGWGRLAVAGFVAGGLATVDAVERADYDVLANAVRPSHSEVARHEARLLIARSPSR